MITLPRSCAYQLLNYIIPYSKFILTMQLINPTGRHSNTVHVLTSISVTDSFRVRLLSISLNFSTMLVCFTVHALTSLIIVKSFMKTLDTYSYLGVAFNYLYACKLALTGVCLFLLLWQPQR